MPRDTPLHSEDLNHNKMFHAYYTFDNFVVGDSNRYAYTAAQTVSNALGKKYNPIFIYGAPGLGKTHLLHAIGHDAQNEGKIVIYATVEQFMNDVTNNLRNQTMDVFRKKYSTCDVLLIDDIQYIAHKFQMQEALYQTLNELYLANKQIVVTSDVPLHQIDGLDDRLKSFLDGGLLTDIGFPDEKTKREII
ncbi:MAG: AAA family ATPase [Erysipelotrichia bacterium]|nr:AAA family ATPase [Erysipelotrichia bacterium]